MGGTVATVRDWSEALLTSLATAMALVFAAIPKILGFLIVIIVGWLIAALVAKAIAALLRSIRFNQLADQSGFSGFIQNTGMRTDAAGAIALTAKWFVRLIALVVAFDALGLPAVSDVLRQLLLWIPNLVVGIVVLVIGGLAANALSNLVRGSTTQAGLGNPDLLATVANVMVWAFAIVIAVNQIGVAETLVNTLFMAVVGAVAIALGLAFGLGGKDTAAKIVEDWYSKSHETSKKIERAVETGTHITQARSTQTPPS